MSQFDYMHKAINLVNESKKALSNERKSVILQEAQVWATLATINEEGFIDGKRY